MKKIFFMLMLTAIVFASCKEGKPSAINPKDGVTKADKTTNVVVATVEEKDLKNYINFSAQPEGIVDITVNSQISGEITSIYKKMGEKVEKGEKIAEIDNEDYQIQKMQAEANLDAAKANYDNVKRQHETNKKLYENGKVISQAEFETSLSKLKSTEASLKMSEANLKKSEKMLDNSMFIAPESGIVNYIFIKKGELVSIGKPICSIVDPTQLLIKGGISQSDIASIKLGQDVTAYHNDNILKGKITGVGIKPVDGANYPIEIVLDNKSQKIFPGMVIKVKIVNKIYKNALYVSSHYVRESLGEKYVYLAIGGEAKKQNIEAGDKIGDYYIVKKGLKLGDKIIIEGIDKIENNSKIKIIDRST